MDLSVEPNLGKEEFPMSRVDVAVFLRELAEQLEMSDNLEVSTSQRHIQLMVHEPINLEIDYKVDDKKKKLEIELEIKEYRGRPSSSLPVAGPVAGPR